MRDLRKKFGDWMGFAWLELLSIGDRNNGIIKGDHEQIAGYMIRVSLSMRLDGALKQARSALAWMLLQGWLAPVEGGLFIANYWNYHRTREPKPELLGSPPNQPNLTITKQTKEEEKNKNKSRMSEHATFEIPNWINPETWNDYLKMRSSKRVKNGDHALALIVKELTRLKALGEEPNEVLEKSTRSNWTDVYPTNNKNKTGGDSGGIKPAPGKYSHLG